MHHGRHGKGQRMPARNEGVALLHGQALRLWNKPRKILCEHGVRLFVAHDAHAGIAQQQLPDAGAVIRLHVIHDEIVERASIEPGGKALKKVLAHGTVDRIEQYGLLIQQQIGIIGNAVLQRKHVLKQSNPAVGCAKVEKVLREIPVCKHCDFLRSKSLQLYLTLHRANSPLD